MSYDLDLYFGKAITLSPPDTGPNGQFSVEDPARCEDEDIPHGYLDLLGKRRRWLCRLHIEGQPDTEALAAFEIWLAEILSQTKGIAIDEQAGRYQTATTTGPLPNTPDSNQIELGEMSFFFEDVETFHQSGLARVLDVIRETLPEAMPTRFGQYEPLQGRIEDGETSALLAAFAEDPEQFLMAKTPFWHIYIHLPCEAELAKWHPNHALRSEFLVGRLTFELRPRAFHDPRLAALLARISSEIGVFYSEIRDHECPTQAWFWRGLPPGPVRAFCVGQKYATLWTEAVAAGRAIGNDVVLVEPTRIRPTLPEPPRELVGPPEPTKIWQLVLRRYAKTFPFDR